MLLSWLRRARPAKPATATRPAGIFCCRCRRPAVVSFGLDEAAAQRYAQGLNTYVSSGEREVLLTFCADHFVDSVLNWPGLIAQPVQPLPIRWREGVAAIAWVKHRLDDPAIRRKALKGLRRKKLRASAAPDGQDAVATFLEVLRSRKTAPR
ncbi:MAG: hypothetical protein KJ904_02215 [Alphaproteobacteria bacterium]|nr:hypothetical protein [Alphaproteobacteria bacterium]MBU0798688.1 hypothetical protein [Alphaproteobacteria bacterium]MBU0885951.1 hypothetical protein [Alphaproteobacteria bacterium]MBU1811940.1 hypothetical protein [Alphaproteobacteria bacterium]MBU2090576.1 hypothetical protein [Alphaproteobacteria bacterium]